VGKVQTSLPEAHLLRHKQKPKGSEKVEALAILDTRIVPAESIQDPSKALDTACSLVL
jgi:hypothetical protein